MSAAPADAPPIPTPAAAPFLRLLGVPTASDIVERALTDANELADEATARLELEARVDVVLEAVRAELLSAIDGHGPMRSPHEALGVIREEYVEFELEVFGDKVPGAHARMLGEVLQVAAMGARAALDLVDVLPLGAYTRAVRLAAAGARALLDLGGARG